MWDTVPWFIGGGAQHSPEVARMMLFAATGGAEGVVLPGDLKVLPLDVPGGAVRAVPGGVLIRNRATGGDSQTYGGRLVTEDVVQIAPTGSGAGRSDLVVARIEDPNMAGETWGEPEDPTVGPYIFTRVIPNVPKTTTRVKDVPGYATSTAIEIARVDLPASTGTVTAAMITDLRRVAVPRSARSLDLQRSSVSQLNATAGEAYFPPNTQQIYVPDWATRLTGYVTANGMVQRGTDEAMATRVRLGNAATGVYSISTVTDLDAELGDAQRRSPIFGISIAIPASMRGTTQPVSCWSTRMYPTAKGRFSTDTATQVLFDLLFEEAPT